MRQPVSENDKYFVIGTANFGFEYGLSSKLGLPSKRDIFEIFQFGTKQENVLFDTSSAYGRSEEFFGLAKKFDFQDKILTKIVITNKESAKEIVGLVMEAKKRTKVNSFHSVLIHNTDDFLKDYNSEVIKGLIECKETGLAGRIGASCYAARDVVRVKSLNENFNAFQLQSSVASRKDFKNSELKNLSEQGNIIFVRSVFLQGLLLNNLNFIPLELDAARSVVSEIHDYCQLNKVTRLKYCLDYARSIEWSSGVIFGLQNYENLLELFEEWNKPVIHSNFPTPMLDEFISDPRNWLKLLPAHR
jgi:aryl-alcohol dehydrogenase-like predicted oxidoreductase